MTAATLDGRIFEPRSVNPPWLRPLVVAIVVALHVAALSILTLAPTPPEPPSEVIVDVQTEAPSQEALKEPEAAPSPSPQDAAPPETAKEPEAITPPPVAEAPPPLPTPPVAENAAATPTPPVAEAQPPEPTPPVAEAQPPEPTPPAAKAPPPETSPPPSAPVELEPAKPPPPPRATPRTEQPPKPAPKLLRPKPENAEREPRADIRAEVRFPRSGAAGSVNERAVLRRQRRLAIGLYFGDQRGDSQPALLSGGRPSPRSERASSGSPSPSAHRARLVVRDHPFFRRRGSRRGGAHAGPFGPFPTAARRLGPCRDELQLCPLTALPSRD